ncbi:MAG: hypothetical protein H0W54_03345 [Rubrobacter sp.]|nr:hypothetical protein [Rubrobacter sp.]
MEGTNVAVNRLDGLGIREWVRGPARVVGDEVILDERRAEPYLLDNPEENEHMAFSLAALPFTSQRPTPAEVENFVQQHGLLWHGRESQGTDECRESLQDWAVAIMQLSFAGVLYKKLTDSKENQTITELQGFLRKYDQYFPNSGGSQEEYRLHATALLRSLMNSGLWGNNSTNGMKTIWSLVMEESGGLQLGYFAPDLLTTAYASFAHLMTNKYRFKTCPGCGALFRPIGRSDKKWCKKGCGSTTRGRKSKAQAKS